MSPLPLENGECLHSREFLRRYDRMPEVKKAELIEGIVYIGSPVSVHHAKPDGVIQAWLGAYASRHPETEALPNTTVILEDDEYTPQQPDAQGRLHSRAFPGLQLPVADVLACDTAKVLAALKESST
ncbi:MAG: hypothetical protein FJ387_03750 [Verrucomicrobia bacterium]|nr:hypothetical protein [Verrucomicrobiota bacterium]